MICIFAGYDALISPKLSYCHVWMIFNLTLNAYKLSTVEPERQNKISKISSMSHYRFFLLAKKKNQRIKNLFHIAMFNVNVQIFSLFGRHPKYLAQLFNVIIRVLSVSVAMKNPRKQNIFSHLMKHDALKGEAQKEILELFEF